MRPPCPGPRQETEGTRYCPYFPELDPEDWEVACADCRQRYDFALDRAIDWYEERDTWG